MSFETAYAVFKTEKTKLIVRVLSFKNIEKYGNPIKYGTKKSCDSYIKQL